MNTEFLSLVGGAGLALLLALFIRSRGWSTALPLMALGAVVDILPFGPTAPPDPELILITVLAPLVFGEALGTSYRELRRVRRPVLALAIGLVTVTALGVGWLATSIFPAIPFAAACALGAVLAPTDAVAVSASAKRAGLPRRIVSVLEGESLVNDASGLTILRVALLAAAAGSLTAAQVLGTLVLSVVSGVAVGAIIGLVLVFALRRFADTVAVNSLIILAPIPVYFLAEWLQGSGILAVVTTALIVANGMHHTVGFRGRLQALEVWRHITYILQTFAFYLIGMEVPHVIYILGSHNWGQLLALSAVVLAFLIAARFVFISGLVGSRARMWGGRTLAWKTVVILSWAGARGPVSGLAAFTIPLVMDSGVDFPQRDLLVATTFLVIVATLLLAPTLAPLARALRIPDDDDSEIEMRARIAILRASLARLETLAEQADSSGEPIPESLIIALQVPVEQEIARDTTHSQPAPESHVEIGAERVRSLQLAMLLAQQEELVRMREEGLVPDTITRRLQGEIDARIHVARGGSGGAHD